MDNSQKGSTEHDNHQKSLLHKLSQQISLGKAKLVSKGEEMKIVYTDSEKSPYDSSQCGKILAPKSNPKDAIEISLELLDMIKRERAPDGVLLDKTKIYTNYKGTYLKGEDYEILDRVLGKGLNGEIVAVRDKKKKSDHALKTMMLALFNTDEIRCWTDLEGYDNFPALYMFNRQNGEIHFHYEILEKAVTITDIIDNHMKKLRGNQKLLRHFSLHVLHGLLEASSIMHSENWFHDDLHEGNVMIQHEDYAELKVRVLDFGRAKRLDETQTIMKDIHEIIRVFTSVYMTQNFQNADDLKKNWKQELEQQAHLYQLSKEYKDELLSLVKLALDVHQTEQEKELKDEVECKLKNSLAENPKIMQTICDLLFPGKDLEVDCVDGASTDFFSFKDIIKFESKYRELTLS